METEQKLGIKTFLYYLYQSVTTGIGILFLAFVIFSINPSLGFISSGLFIFAFFVIAAGVVRSWIKYVSCTFVLGEHALIIKRGIISKKEISIPYRQIQNVNLEQSAIYRIMNVSKLIILTAGQDGNDTVGESEGVFDVIDASVAKYLQEDLLKRTNIQQVETAR